MILKILALVIVVAIVYFLFFKSSRKETNEQQKRDTKDLKDGEEIMVECKKCGTYCSNKEAIIKNNEFYCSRECAGL